MAKNNQRFRYRCEKGKLILQIEDIKCVPDYPDGGDYQNYWRDAMVEDITEQGATAIIVG